MGSVDASGPASTSRSHDPAADTRLAAMAVVGFATFVVGRIAWRKGRRTLDPVRAARKSYQGQSFRQY
jgi:hypothetical protein